MTVRELPRDQLAQLKQAYICELLADPSWGDLADAQDLPDDIIFEHYDGIEFVDDDFT